MRQIIVLLSLSFLLACKKENKEPVCRFTKIAGAGSATKSTVTYSGDTMVTVSGNYPDYTLYYNQQQRLVRREQPAINPYYRSEMAYNANGQVTELLFNTKLGNSWVYQGKLVFLYDNGRIINVREDNAASQPGNMYDYQLTWQGNDIQSVMERLNQQAICTTKFSYDGTIPNPMRGFSDFYFCDGDANYTNYKLPYYFSEHLVTKQESTCPLSETRLFNYTFTSNALVESMVGHTGYVTGVMWEYEYECR